MENSKFLKVVIIILLLINLATLGFMWTRKGPPMGPPPHRDLVEFLSRELNLSQEQKEKFETLKNEHRATPAQISMAKRNNVNIALQIAREARQIHGGMGITGEYPIMRHMMNLESVVTYEGTHDIHLLITGLDITGISAFE